MPDQNDLYVTVAAVGIIALWITLAELYGARVRPTSDVLRACRTMGPRLNAVVVSGEYLSAASFLGVAGLVLKRGVDALWYPVGFTAGYLAMLLFVAAPLRRSGAYTLPDFAELRLGSVRLRRICSLFAIIISWLYLVPQLEGAGLTVHAVTEAPMWVGAAVLMVIVTFNIYTGWRSITILQAFQYWIKLTALAIPVFVLLIHSRGATLHLNPGSQVPVISDAVADNNTWLRPLGYGKHPLLATYSLIVALLLGAMGLPQVLGRHYTDPNGRSARRTTQLALVLLGVFYLFPMAAGWLARLYVPRLLVAGNPGNLGNADAALLLLPSAALGGWPAILLSGLIAAGAFAAFVSAANGLVVSVAGGLCTDVLPARLRDFRVATVVAWSVPLAFVLAVSSLDLAQGVGLAFAVAASSFCPLLVLGIWWRGLTDIGARAGILAGGGVAVAAVLPAAAGVLPPGWQEVAAQPAAFTVPLAFLTMIVVSRRTKDRVPTEVSRILLRLHAPDRLGLAEDRERGQRGTRVGMSTDALSRIYGGRHRR
ncbi:MAG: cation acetate symporter [Pseudonocardiaceae bacterium]